MRLSNHEKGVIIRDKQRANLAKKIEAFSIKVENNNRTYTAPSFEPGSRSLSTTGHQTQAAVNGAVSAARRAINESGLTGLRYVEASHKIESEVRSARLHVIREASFHVTYDFPTTDGEKVTASKVDVGVVLDNGRYSVLGLRSASGYLPLTKSNLKAASNYTSKDFEDKDEEGDDYLDEKFEKDEKPKSNKYVMDKKRKRESEEKDSKESLELKKKVASRKTAQNILQNPEDNTVNQADPDTEMLRQDVLNMQSKVNSLEAQVQSYRDALASKTAQELGLDATSYNELSTFLSQTQSTLDTKIKKLEGNFIKFADGVIMAKVQGAKLNDASWKDMIDSARTKGRGVMKRVTTILDQISILFKKMTANVSLKEYAPGELTPKEQEKITKKNTENVNKINKYQDDVMKQAPKAQKYFLDNAEGKIQPPGFKGAQKSTEQQLEFDFLKELDAQLDEQNAELEKANAQLDALNNQGEKQEKLDQAYPLPKQASKGLIFTSATGGPTVKVRRTIAQLKDKGFSKKEISDYLQGDV